MKAYLDSSFLFSMYLKDVNSPAAASYLKQNKPQLFLSILTETEFFNAAERRIFRKQLTRVEAEAAYALYRQDVEAGLFYVLDIEPSTWDTTQKITVEHTAKVGCGTADVVHVAAALLYKADTLLTFDIRQKELAARVNLPTN